MSSPVCDTAASKLELVQKSLQVGVTLQDAKLIYSEKRIGFFWAISACILLARGQAKPAGFQSTPLVYLLGGQSGWRGCRDNSGGEELFGIGIVVILAMISFD